MLHALSLIVAVSLSATSAGADPALQWIEAEQYAEQRGSTAARFDMPGASGAACVDNDWGGRKDDYLCYRFSLAGDVAQLHVALRYARAMPGEAVVRLTVDGDTKRSTVVRLASTGDWGFRPDGWKYAAAVLPACAGGAHTLEIRSAADRNNVNLDGFYLGSQPIATTAATEPRSGPEDIAALDERLFPLLCKTPVALPYSRRKALVAGGGLVQTLLGTPTAAGMGGNVAGPALHVKLAGRGPWTRLEQRIDNEPVPTVRTRFFWPQWEMEQAVFAAAPQEQGFFVSVTVRNKSPAAAAVELVSLVQGAAEIRAPDAIRLVSGGQTMLRALPTSGVSTAAVKPAVPGPLGAAAHLCHRATVPAGASIQFDLQLLGDGLSHDAARAAAAQVWRKRLKGATPVRLPNAKLQHAFDASLRQMLALIEDRPAHARVLKGLQHYYGSNPYDNFQASRALDAVGLKADAETLLRHQLAHLKDDGIFEMWETGDLAKAGADQWIVQGLAARGLWEHYCRWGDEVWLRAIAPTLVKAAQATLRARRAHAGVRRQGMIDVEGWLPPLGGDGGLGVGYHWSQNAGPLDGVRIAAEAAARLKLPEADQLREGWLDFRRAYDRVRRSAAAADPGGMLPSFPGATGADRTRPLWGVVMSVTAFDAIPHDDPVAVRTLRFLQSNRLAGLHRNLGYSQGVWPYLSAEVALWHLRLGETREAWRILEAMADRASSTVCWYEEIDDRPPRGHGDPADVWAAAEMVYLACQLATSEAAEPLPVRTTSQ